MDPRLSKCGSPGVRQLGFSGTTGLARRASKPDTRPARTEARPACTTDWLALSQQYCDLLTQVYYLPGSTLVTDYTYIGGTLVVL